MSLEHIQMFSPIFANLEQKNPVASAAYYILLLKSFPTNFNAINREASNMIGRQYKLNQLREARFDLLREGLIAQVLPLPNQDIDFGREMYIPIAPKLLWEDNISKLRSILGSEEIDHRQGRLGGLQEIYLKNFKKYGIGTETGNISVFHTTQWALYNMIYNLEHNKHLRLLYGSLRSFEEPYIRYYMDIIEKNIKTKIIYDRNDKNANMRLANIIGLKLKHPQNIELRGNLTINGTSRKFIYDNMAIDATKLILNGKSKESFYISTIYLQANPISFMKDIFDSMWDLLGPQSQP
jgi:hypothetical protein